MKTKDKRFEDFDCFVPMWRDCLYTKGLISPRAVFDACLINRRAIEQYIDNHDHGLFRAQFWLDELMAYYGK